MHNPSLPKQTEPPKVTFIIGLDIAGWQAGTVKQFALPDVGSLVRRAKTKAWSLAASLTLALSLVPVMAGA